MSDFWPEVGKFIISGPSSYAIHQGIENNNHEMGPTTPSGQPSPFSNSDAWQNFGRASLNTLKDVGRAFGIESPPGVDANSAILNNLSTGQAINTAGAMNTGLWNGNPVYGRSGQQLGTPVDVLGSSVGDRRDLYGMNTPGFAQGYGALYQNANDLQMVRDRAMGKGPSVAENFARSQLDASIRAQAAQAASARGGNLAGAERAAADAAAQTRLQGVSQLGALRAGEMSDAQKTLVAGGQGLGQAFTGLGQGVGAQNLAAAGYESDQSRAYADYLQKQWAIAQGLPVNWTALGLQQQQLANQQQGARLNAGSTLLAAAL
jgi:hypothetical protein